MKRLIFLFLAVFVSTSAYCGQGVTSLEIPLLDWSSLKLCGFEGCVWRARTAAYDTSLMVDFSSDKRYSISMVAPLSEARVVSMRGQKRDLVFTQVRIDNNAVIKTVVERTVLTEPSALYFNFNPNDFNNSFLDQFRQGERFSVQMLTDDGEIELSFSLRGARNAITRAKNNAWGTKDK